MWQGDCGAQVRNVYDVRVLLLPSRRLSRQSGHRANWEEGRESTDHCRRCHGRGSDARHYKNPIKMPNE